MRNVKMLWGAVSFLLVCLFILAGLLLSSQFEAPRFGTTIPSAPSEDPTDHPTQRDSIVATIGGHRISNEQFLQNLRKRYGTLMLDQMLDHIAIALEGQQLQIDVTDEQIDTELKRMQQGYDDETLFYKSMMDQLGLSRTDLREDVYYRLLLENIAIHTIDITDQQVDAYIEEHPEEFAGRTQLHLSIIIVNSKLFADQIIARLTEGSKFEQLARQHSIDEITAEIGGDLGWVELDDPFIPVVLLDAAAQLERGEVSKPVHLGDENYGVIKLVDRKKLSHVEQSQVREYIRKELALSEASSLKELVERLRSKYNATTVDPMLQY